MMNSQYRFVIDCQNKVFSGQPISDIEAEKLLNIQKSELETLSDSANKITRKFQGNKVDVEQLSNIKKNYCSEDCSFCGQSAFFNTNIDDYQLLPKEEVVSQAKKAIKEGAQSYCLVAAWRQPSDSDFSKVCNIIKEINDKVGISIECSLGFLTVFQANQLKKLGVKI
jgi:biotin synthase